MRESQTNFLYLADKLLKRHERFFRGFQQALEDAAIPYALLPHTRDVWALDYMPVQLEDETFVQCQYNPDYLRSTIKWRKTITDTRMVCDALGIKPFESNIVLDGGNVSLGDDAVILCDKIFSENPGIDERALIRQVEDLFRVSRVIIIPTHPFDITGHSDGILRWYDKDTVLLNNYKQDPTGYGLHIRMALHNAGIRFIELPYNPFDNSDADDATGEYINFLWMQQAILLPVFGMPEDEQAIRMMEQLFPGKPIRSVPSRDLSIHGGVLHCISWNIIKS